MDCSELMFYCYRYSFESYMDRYGAVEAVVSIYIIRTDETPGNPLKITKEHQYSIAEPQSSCRSMQ